MQGKRMLRTSLVTVASLTALLLLSSAAFAQTQIQGVIDGRSGATMTVKTLDAGNVVVLLTSTTQVEEVEGGLKMRKKEMGLTALIPGLPVEVKGSTVNNQLVAEDVKFKGSDLKTAQDMQASMAPVQAQAAAEAQQLAAEQQKIQATQQAVQAQQQQLAAEQAKIDANKAAVAATNKRFSELGEYNIMGEVDVLFANGKVLVAPEYRTQLLQLAQKAKAIDGYMIQVKGYASAVGSSAMNQRLSTERANNVTEFLEQKGGVPLTNMLAPGAMGTSKQVAPDNTAEGQADNRRVTVKILQNKGIAGT
jgi:OmpA-OmpF porin, OOP family